MRVGNSRAYNLGGGGVGTRQGAYRGDAPRITEILKREGTEELEESRTATGLQ